MITLEHMENEVQLIKYKKKMTPVFIAQQLPRMCNPMFVKRRIKLFKNKLKQRDADYDAIIKNRNEQFKMFIEQNFRSHVTECIGYDKLTEKAREFDAVVVGSDQLWLPSGMGSNFYNLLFVPDEIRKVSFATSFGVSYIPFYQVKKTGQYLNRFDYIGVREETGKKIVEEVSDKKAEVILDPTLLIEASEWRKCMKKNPVEGKYIFCYFLGNNPEHRKQVDRFAKEKGLKVYNLAHIDEYVAEDKLFSNVSDVGPFEFINLIDNAEYVFTDSFHASVFSILFNKKFIVFNRFSDADKNSRNSRIDNLMKKLGLESRRHAGDIGKVADEIDYGAVQGRLDALREKSFVYLRKALG
jgi:hypothetical protein